MLINGTLRLVSVKDLCRRLKSLAGELMTKNDEPYFPPPESKGGWRVLSDPKDVSSVGRIDPSKLKSAWRCNVQAEAEPRSPQQKALNPFDSRLARKAKSSSVMVIRHGYVVGEWYQNADEKTLWNIYSCTKSFTGTACGMLFRDSAEGKLLGKGDFRLDSSAYSHIPEGFPLTDSRKERIRIGHLLTMTSCIKGEDAGVFGLRPAEGFGPFELALGRCPTADGVWVSELWGEPGTRWDYSDPAFAHLALIFRRVAGIELAEYLRQRLFDPIGIEDINWDYIGGEDGTIGPHTLANGGLHITARDLARFGYLALNHGVWAGREMISGKWMEKATQTSQSLNKNYGYTWWVNTQGTLWQGVPKDTFAAMGFNSNKCYVIPSLDLVVIRVGDGPWPWDDGNFLRTVIASAL